MALALIVNHRVVLGVLGCPNIEFAGGKGAILRSSFFKIGVVRGRGGEPLRVIATGAGNGHGIGLCQWGAMGMARAGAGYKTILRHYYKGAVLSKVS